VNEDQIRHHIAYKRDGERTLPAEVAQRMLDALDAGAEPDYQKLLAAARWTEPGPQVFHTAPASERAVIGSGGLEARDPNENPRWGDGARGQAVGVYVAAEPDERGIWAETLDWDVWALDTSALADLGLDLERDPINPGCWFIASDVPAEAIALHGTYGRW
jgi:hypothetical protein